MIGNIYEFEDLIEGKRYYHPVYGWGVISKQLVLGHAIPFYYEGDLIEIYITGQGYIDKKSPVLIKLKDLYDSPDFPEDRKKEASLYRMSKNPKRKPAEAEGERPGPK